MCRQQPCRQQPCRLQSPSPTISGARVLRPSPEGFGLSPQGGQQPRSSRTSCVVQKQRGPLRQGQEEGVLGCKVKRGGGRGRTSDKGEKKRCVRAGGPSSHCLASLDVTERARFFLSPKLNSTSCVNRGRRWRFCRSGGQLMSPPTTGPHSVSHVLATHSARAIVVASPAPGDAVERRSCLRLIGDRAQAGPRRGRHMGSNDRPRCLPKRVAFWSLWLQPQTQSGINTASQTGAGDIVDLQGARSP